MPIRLSTFSFRSECGLSSNCRSCLKRSRRDIRTVFRYRGNVTPPKDYEQWATLIRKLTAHWVDRYGAAEVRKWFFEVWNEPNLKAFWTGSQEDYFKLYRRTVTAIKSVDESLKVGGPATADNQWIPEFLDYCKKNALSVDFVSTRPGCRADMAPDTPASPWPCAPRRPA